MTERTPYRPPARRGEERETPLESTGTWRESAERRPREMQRVHSAQADYSTERLELAEGRREADRWRGEDVRRGEMSPAPRMRYANRPELKVQERYYGEPGVGATLRTYKMQIWNLMSRWKRDRLEPEEFFRGMSCTLAGEAESYYCSCVEEHLEEYAGRPADDWSIITCFFEKLKKEFPLQTKERMQEFASYTRKRGESLVSYMSRLKLLAADMGCDDPTKLIDKFMGGLDPEMRRDLRQPVYDLDWRATLQSVYELACRYEMGSRRFDFDTPQPRHVGPERRRPAWSATPVRETGTSVASIRPEDGPMAEAPASIGNRGGGREARDGPDTRRCHRCGAAGHIQRFCDQAPKCDKCGKEGHLRRDCPEWPACERCGKRGHKAESCYSRNEGIAKREGEPAWSAQLERVTAGISRMKAQGDEEPGGEEENEDWGESEASFVLMARPPRQREEIELRSGTGHRIQEPPRERQWRRRTEKEPEIQDPASRHPAERIVCQSSVLVAAKGSILVGGLAVEQAIIDTGAHYVLIGRGLAARLELSHPDRIADEGILLMTAEGGPAKEMPCTKAPIEIVLMPGTAEEARVRIRCGITDSEDYDLLVGMELLYRVGATICTWQEKVIYRPYYWKEDGPRGVLPVRFIKQEPRAAYQARMMRLEDQLGEWTWEQQDVEEEERRERRKVQDRQLELAPYIVKWTLTNDAIVVMELFGGIGSGLAAVLEAGLVVRKWILVELNPTKRKMAMQHLQLLRERFPDQISLGAEDGYGSDWEPDIRNVEEEHIKRWGPVDILIAGWECQGVSRAGRGLGIDDNRAALFTELMRVMKLLYRVHGDYLYILENPDIALDPRMPVREMHKKVTAELGAGVAIDAAQLGARAHRLRRYWQNGVTDGRLQWELAQMSRPTPRPMDAILDPGRTARGVIRPDHPTQYQCNQPGEPREALPTLVAYRGAQGFSHRDGVPGPGMIWDHQHQEWQEPTAEERERAMGLLPRATAAEGVTEKERRAAIGEAMDVHTLHWMIDTVRFNLELKAKERNIAELRGEVARDPSRLQFLAQELERLGEMKARKEAVLSMGWPLSEHPREDPEVVVVEEPRWQRGATLALMAAEGRKEGGEEQEWQIGETLGARERGALSEYLKNHKEVFAFTVNQLGKYKGREMEINLTMETPTYQRRRRMSPGDEEICREKCAELLEAGLIRRSESDFAAATVIAARTDMKGEVLARRMCGDYRDLNKQTAPDRYPMPTAEEIFDKLGEAQYFTTLDMRQGFNQIKIREADCRKTAFHGADGLYEWLYMPFGLRNASAVFQREMDTLLREIPAAACYIDDVVIFSKEGEQHVEDVKRVLGVLQEAGLTCHPKKCKFAMETVQYLGFEVSGGKMAIQKAKVAILDQVAAPKDKSALRALLGFLNYYRKFVPDFSRRAAPLNALLRDDKKWEWGEKEQKAALDLLGAVKTGPVLRLPKRDAPFTLYTDWSSSGMGAILCQQQEGQEGVVAFASRSCSPSEANYSSYTGEALAAVWGIAHFRVYLQGSEFTLVTDHQPLTWLMTTPNLTGRNARWAMSLQEYAFKIKHRPGKTIQHADGLSRNPPPTTPEACLVALAGAADAAAAAGSQEQGPADVWADAETMAWIQGGTAGESPAGVRARSRGKHYRWHNEQVQLQTEQGWKMVPKPQEREEIIWAVHKKLGHFGHVRTHQLISTGWWWAGMRKEIREVVNGCEACSRNRASLDTSRHELHSLPI